jgi:putative endonuclease
MFFVYILRDKISGKNYTGYTANLKQRIGQHFSGDVHTTHRMSTIELIYYEAFNNVQDAREREKYLKTTRGKRTLKIMLKYTFGAFV